MRTKTRMKARLRPLYLAVAALFFNCATLESIPSGTCGNGVVDATEDCDTFPAARTALCGGPSEGAAACRLHCGKQASGDTLACPDGWGCGVSGVCRAPTGTFATSLPAVSAGLTDLAVGDFDGDGRQDILGSTPRTDENASRVRVHYFDDVAGLAQVVPLPSQLISPIVLDFDHDGRDDIAFGLGIGSGPGGLGVVTGLANRDFRSVLFPGVTAETAEVIPISVRASSTQLMPNGRQSEILLFGRSASGAALTSLDAEAGRNDKLLNRVVPVSSEAVVGRPIAARLFDAEPLSTCGEIAMAVEAASESLVYVLSPCTIGDPSSQVIKWEGTAARGLVKLKVPSHLKPNGLFLVDFNFDDHIDIVVSTDVGLYVTLNTGSAFSTGFTPVDLQAEVANATLRGIADLNADHIVDYVSDGVIFLSTKKSNPSDAGSADAATDGGGSSSTYKIAAFAAAGGWSDAVIGKFNGDEFLDVATTRADSPDVTIFAGSRSSAFTPFTVPTETAVEQIVKGDFDGDQVSDLAIAEATSVAGTSDLAIAYGRAIGGPEPARVVGSVAQPQSMFAVRNEGGAFDDLGLYAFGAKLASGLRPTAVTFVGGSGDRQTLAPLLYLDRASTAPALNYAKSRQWVPGSLVAGHFHTANLTDVFASALAYDGPRTGANSDATSAGSWEALADPKAQGGLRDPVQLKALGEPLQVASLQGLARNLAFAKGDLDNADDKLDEIVLVTNERGGSGSSLRVVRRSPGAAPPVPTMLPDAIPPGAKLELFDVDGDGFRDLVGMFGPKDSVQVQVRLNDGKGNFGAVGVSVSLVAPAGAPAATQNAKAFAAITVGGAPAIGSGRLSRSLAIVTARGLWLAALRSDKSAFDAIDLTAKFGTAGLRAATGVAAGDFNGDGVEDLAVADDGALRVMLQLPARSR